jgi:hypothetical protein
MKEIIALILITVFVTGCEAFDKKDRHFSLGKEGLSLLKVGDTLVYKSNLNNKAVYTVLKKITGSIWEERDPGMLSLTVEGNNMARDYFQFEAVLIDSAGKKLSEKQNTTLARKNEQTFGRLSSMPCLVFGCPDFITVINDADGSTFAGTGKLSAIWYSSNPVNYKTSSSMKILNKNFEKVFYCSVNQTADQTKRNVILIYCNSKNGLLGFKYSDGEIFELN